MSTLADHVIVASPWDPASPRSWSGVVLPMMEALREEFARVDFVPTGTETALVDRVLARVYGLRDRTHLPAWSPPSARRRSRPVARALRTLPESAPIIGIAATPELLEVPSSRRIVQVTDSSFAALADTYPDLARVPALVRRKALRIEHEVAERTEAFVVASAWSRERLIDDLGVHPSLVRVARLGPGVRPRPGEVRRPKHPDAPLRLLFVASDWGRKGGDLAISTVDELRRRGHDVLLTVVGDAVPTLPEHAVRAGRLDREQMSSMYLTHDVLLEPSRASAGGVVVTDALHHGLPVLATATGGLTDLVVDGRSGWLVADDGTPAPFISAVEDRVLIADLESFSDEAARWAADNADWSGWARSVRAAIEGLSEAHDEGEMPQ